MADYKIANIKWLREQGWEISSSYADSMCPTYYQITNVIDKDSKTIVDVNGTCIATSQAYSSNQLVCEDDIHITIITEIIATLTLNNGSTVDIGGSGELTSSMIESYKTTVTKAEIKDTCTSIGYAAFQDCTSITSVTIPNSVTSIGSTAFASCSSLTSIVIPNSVTSIGNAAFQVCTSLTSVTLPNSVTSISDSTFASCSSLTSITLPNSVTSIGSTVFASCSSLASVTIGNSVTTIGNGTFSSCISLTNVTLPNSVTTIGRGVFAGCTGLTSMTFPSSVTNIGAAVLTACTSLERITVERVEPPTIEYNTFVSTNECPIYVPCESVTTYKTSWSQYADRITCDSVDCSVYGWTQYTDTIEPSTTSYLLATSNIQQPALNVQVVDSGGFVQGIVNVPYSSDEHGYVGYFTENTSSSSKQATIRYTSQDNTCEWPQVLTQKGVVDCSVYNWTPTTLQQSMTGNVGGSVGTSLQSAGELTLYLKPSWVQYVGVQGSGGINAYICKALDNTSTKRNDTITFKSSDGKCTFTSYIEQDGKDVDAIIAGVPSVVNGNVNIVGENYSMLVRWVNGVKTVEYGGTIDTGDTAQDIHVNGGVQYQGGSATIVDDCGSCGSCYYVVSATWSSTSDKFTLYITLSQCT